MWLITLHFERRNRFCCVKKLQEKKFDSLESARKEGECIFKAQYIGRHPYDI